MAATQEKKSVLKRVYIPWQFYLVLIVILPFIFPGIVGYVVYTSTGSNGISGNAAVMAEGLVVAFILLSWFISSRRSKN